MEYPQGAIPESSIPRAAEPLFQHLLDTYASEINKVDTVWSGFSDSDLGFRPHPKSGSVSDVLKHELLSGRRFFGEFLGAPEPAPADTLPGDQSVSAFRNRLRDLALPRLGYLSSRGQGWWLERVRFFDVTRERLWIFWRRVLHTAHHRTQLTTYLRLLNRPVPAVYGPTADVTWSGADPTRSVESSGRAGLA